MKQLWPPQYGQEPLSRDDIQTITGFDARVIEKLDCYLACLQHWQSRINLVGNSTLKDPWRRHILDSLQLLTKIARPTDRIVDLGSGAGFPGMALAIAGCSDVHLLESDARKCAFLHQVVAETGARAKVVNKRIEDVEPFTADVVTARALAPLDRLIGYAHPFLESTGYCLFLKGAAVEQELTAAAKTWKMQVQKAPSLTDPAGSILSLKGISRRDNG